MKHLSSWIALLIGLTLTAAAWLLLSSQNSEAQESRFVQECSLLNSRMQSQLDQQVLILKGLERTLASYVDVVRDVFELAVSIPGNSQPGIVSIGYAALIEQKELSSYVDYVRRSAYPAFYVHPEGLRDRYLPIAYSVSQKGTDSLLGFDLLTILPVDAVKDTTAATHVLNIPAAGAADYSAVNIMLTRSVKNEKSLLADEGTCFIVLDPRIVLSSGLTYAYDSSRVAFSVTQDIEGQHVLFSPASTNKSSQTHNDSLFIGDALWYVEYQAREEAFQTENHDLPSILLVIGVFFSTIIFILMRIVETRLQKRSE